VKAEINRLTRGQGRRTIIIGIIVIVGA